VKADRVDRCIVVPAHSRERIHEKRRSVKHKASVSTNFYQLPDS